MPESATLPAASSERLSRPIAQSVGLARRVDALLVALVLAFAFVVGSFVARNSDVWLHLATGRLIVAGEYSFGADPFAFTTTDQYWANHSWLFDALFYLAVTQFGGGATVVVKSLVVALTAGAMLFAARGRGSVWVPAIVVMLAVLAMSPRVLLQPSVVSFLLLAVCLCALRTGRRALIAVPVLIAVWVNLDAWFLLGPALVGLFWLGRRIDPECTALQVWPAWFMPASCAACLVSPHHIFALRFPAELSPRVWSGFAEDPRLAGVFVSPWHLGPLSASGGYNLAAWAFIVLFVLGVLSFGVNRRALRSWRFTVWLPFALLAAWQARLIPFFAVVAGPIVALNLREVVSSMAFTRPGRAFALTVGITLLALAWFGRLNGFHNRDRGAAWAIHTDPSLANAAKGVAAWRAEQGVPPEARILALHPDMGHYLAWFAPGERTFIDSRLQLFTGVADDWKTLSRAVGLLPNGTPADTLFRKHNIVAVLLSDPDGGRLTRAMRDATSRWDVARIDGASVLLVPKQSKGERFDPEATAFGGGGIGVPANGSPNLAEPIPWWEFRRTTGRGGSWEADAATVYLRLFEDAATKSPAFPILAVRASRVGIEADSTDPTAWLMLGRGYSQLGERTWERELGNGFTPLEHVRLVQLAGALVQAVLRNPDSVPAHEGLTAVMLRRNSLDLALRHATEGLRLTRRSGALPGETVEAFGDRIARAAALVESLEASVLDGENRYLIRTTGLSGDPLARARIAAELGLSQRAIDVLLKSHPDLYGIEGLWLLADLLLQTGQAAECRALLDRAELRRRPDVLGVYNLPGKPGADGHRWSYRFHAYDWFDLCQCSAAGRYTDAAAALERLSSRLRNEEEAALPPKFVPDSARIFASEVGLAAPPMPVLGRLMISTERGSRSEAQAHAKFLSVAVADLTTLGAILELERGEIASATAKFETALAAYGLARNAVPALPGEPLARRYLESLKGKR